MWSGDGLRGSRLCPGNTWRWRDRFAGNRLWLGNDRRGRLANNRLWLGNTWGWRRCRRAAGRLWLGDTGRRRSRFDYRGRGLGNTGRRGDWFRHGWLQLGRARGLGNGFGGRRRLGDAGRRRGRFDHGRLRRGRTGWRWSRFRCDGLGLWSTRWCGGLIHGWSGAGRRCRGGNHDRSLAVRTFAWPSCRLVIDRQFHAARRTIEHNGHDVRLPPRDARCLGTSPSRPGG